MTKRRNSSAAGRDKEKTKDDGPAPSSSSSNSHDQSVTASSTSPPSSSSSSPPSAPKRKRKQVSTACENCRMAKLRCDGKHPICVRCARKSVHCVYDVAVEGLTRREYLRLQFEQQKLELEKCTVVMDRLRYSSDREATELLARLRIGYSVEQLYERLMLFQLRPASPKPQDRRLEGIDDAALHQRPVLRPLDVKPPACPSEPVESQGGSPTMSSPAEVSPVLSREWIQDEGLVFPTYRRRAFDEELLNPTSLLLEDDDGQT